MFSLSNLCFLCLNSSNNLKPVLIETNEEVLVQKQLKYCLPEMDVDFLTEVPKYICSNCISKLESLYKFKQTCLQNNTYLKNYIQTLTSTHGSNKHLSVNISDIKYQNNLQAVNSSQPLPSKESDELRNEGNGDNGGTFIKDSDSKHEIMFVDVLDIERSHSYIKEENEIFVKEEFLTSEDNVDDEYVTSIKCETITSDSDVSVSRIEDVQENSKYSNCSSEYNSNKPKQDQITLFMNQGRYTDDNAQMETESSPWDRCSPMHEKWKGTQDTEGYVEEKIEGEEESSTSVWQDERTAFNTSVQSTTGESSSTMYETEKINVISEDNLMRAKRTTEVLIPTKSKAIYDKEFKIFVNWKLKNEVTVVNETVMMKYFLELSEKYTPNSLWTKYSILKSALIVNDNVDISPFTSLVPFLKKQLKGYIPKKSKVLTGDQVLMFMKNAPNEKHLLHKVVLVMGLFGGLRRDEMVRMTIDDIQDKGSVLLVRVPETNNTKAKSFTIVEEEEIGALKLVRKYAALRPTEIKERRFFLTYIKNRCTRQPVGKNTIGSVPTIIATYLKLDNAKEYTGHCLRRTSSTLLVEAGTTFETLKLNGKLKSTQIAKRYVTESIASKNRIARTIASSVSISGEDKGESSTNVWQDEGTTFNTSVNFLDRSTTGESSSTVCETEKINDISEDILMRAKNATEDLILMKSRAIYDKEFKIFVDWKLKNAITLVNETVMMTYFLELSEKYSPNSLWTKYSILKSGLIVNDNVDISHFKSLVPFLKKKLKGYIPKKSKVLTEDQVLMFMKNAPNEKYLMHKVVLVMGVFGGLRRDEMVKMTIDDIQDKGSVLLVKLPETRAGTVKGFTIVEEEEIGALKLVRTYAALRPTGLTERRFFLTYTKNSCTRQPVGKNTIGSVPTVIATYLKLDNAKEYTGHCLQRMSSTLLIEAGATFETSKMHGKWKSTQIAEECLEGSIASKNRFEGKGEYSTNVWQDEGTAFNTSADFHVRSTNEEFSSTVCETQKNTARSSEVSFPGTFEICNFFLGTDSNK